MKNYFLIAICLLILACQAAAEPVIFYGSDPASPGESVVISGSQFGKTFRIELSRDGKHYATVPGPAATVSAGRVGK